MIERIEQLRAQAEGEIAKADSSEALEGLRVGYLGRKAELPQLLRGVAELAPAERGAVGKAANQARAALEALIEARVAAVSKPGAKTAPASSQQVRVELHWTGGAVTEHQLTRPVKSWQQVSDVAGVRECLRHGEAAGWTSQRIAEELNAAGHRSPRGQPFTAASVRQLRKRLGPATAKQRRRRKQT